jgi:hypothetical protein
MEVIVNSSEPVDQEMHRHITFVTEDSRLQLFTGAGDHWISIMNHSNYEALMVRFCAPSNGGGQSVATFNMLGRYRMQVVERALPDLLPLHHDFAVEREDDARMKIRVALNNVTGYSITFTPPRESYRPREFSDKLTFKTRPPSHPALRRLFIELGYALLLDNKETIDMSGDKVALRPLETRFPLSNRERSERDLSFRFSLRPELV